MLLLSLAACRFDGWAAPGIPEAPLMVISRRRACFLPVHGGIGGRNGERPGKSGALGS